MRNKFQSAAQLKKRINKNDDRAMVQLGAKYYTGENAPRDYKKAKYWYEKSAECNNYWADCNLGYIYYYGMINGEIDYQKAFNHYMKAVALGNRNAMYKIGDFYYEGILFEQDYKTALLWYEKALNETKRGDHNHANIAYRLARCHLYGHGTNKDILKAIDYLGQAEYRFYYEMIENNDEFAERTLGKVQKLLDEARKEIRKE
jgi:TPR repeat protein